MDSCAFITGKLDDICVDNAERERVTVLARRANLLKFLLESSSIGFFRAVISRKVNKNKTTTFFSFLIGAIWSNNQIGTPALFVWWPELHEKQ